MSYRGKEKASDLLPVYNDSGNGQLELQGKKWRVWKKQVGGIERLKSWIDVEEFTTRDANIVGSVIISWVIIVNFVERIHVKYVLRKCQWKHWEQWQPDGDPHRIVLIADPQLVDENTYPERPDILNYFVKKLSDNYLHKCYRFMQHYIDPDTIFFLGDLFDGGREWNDDLWFKEYRRFNKIFPKQPNRRTIQSLAGNHDIGFETIDINRLKRFSAFFGPPNDFIELGNHTIVLIDSISLSSEDPAIKNKPRQFLDNLNDLIQHQFPRILLTHVPLYRYNNKQLCGSLRESSNLFPIQKGTQYQTVITSDLSSQILETVKPLIVFSGDDHDYCDVNHKLHDGSLTREITVKSTSMTAGIKYPAIQLLSLNNPINSPAQPLKGTSDTFQTEMCFLPSPYFGLTLYILWLIVSISVLAINFIMPELFDKSLIYLTRTFKRDVTLPFFTSTFQSQTTVNYRRRDVKLFLVSLLSVLLFVYIIIGLYYSNV